MIAKISALKVAFSDSNGLHYIQYVRLVSVYRVMVLILLSEYLPKQCFHSLNMNEYMKYVRFLKTFYQDMALRDRVHQYFRLIFFRSF